MRKQVSGAVGKLGGRKELAYGGQTPSPAGSGSCRYTLLSVIQFSACYHGDVEQSHYMVGYA